MKGLAKIEPLPSMTQLRNYKLIIRQQKHGYPGRTRRVTSILHIPEDIHAVFVVSFEVSNDDDNSNFRFILSTKYLYATVRLYMLMQHIN